ncbi:putative Ig domain-containing protein [Chryseobacterium wangxinyae]|uniref:T9SS type A sorting domain-containing protein n=1 Tax=Chryseobacterium sp. CY350 TaxID=2997336 RepID=UPI00226DA764|nr:T9SS type A sorting domain-containing protein [Chryseobacterium sp. CY350]MCY0979364.1 putative Ig domain-containing protein [Chryseobacterium sp. CY350]WBZ97138.1 putative Ig domain-containing protein [Chryseobacterium sp. CY350]
MNLKLQNFSKMSLAFLMALFSVWGMSQTITIDLTSAGGSTNLGVNAYASGAERTWTQTGVGFGGKAITSAISPNAGTIQAQASNGVVYNTTAIPGRIKTIQVNQNAATSFTLFGGTSRLVNSTTGNYTVTGGTSAGSVTGTTWTSGDLSANNYTFFVLKKGTAAAYITSIVITYESANTPNFTTTGTFNAFSYVEGNGPSASQSIATSGSNLDNTAVTVTAPTNFEVSLTGGNDFADTKTITYTGGAFSAQSVYARLKSGLALGAYSGNIILAGGSVATNTNIAVTGNVTAIPTVTASTFTGNVGAVFSQNIVATQTPTSYALVSGSNLPSGLTLNTTTGEITGTSASAGTFTTDVTATNASGTSVAATITITIAKGSQTLTGFSDITKYASSPAFTFPANTTNANLTVAYTSSNPAVATVSGNTVTVTGLGTTTITAAQAGDTNWNVYNQQIVLTVANDPVTYNGIGRFEKINSLANLTDGYYVIADANDEVITTNTITSGTLVTSNLNAVNNEVINPPTNNVWNITNVSGVYTVQNSNDSKYLSYAGGSTNLSTVATLSNTQQRWNVTYVNAGYYSFKNASDATRILKYNAGLGTPGFKAYAPSSQLPEVALYKRIETTVWNGTTWSNGTPDGKDVILTGVYSTNSLPVFAAKNITIKNSGVLEITTGSTVSALDVTIENGGNLVQKDGSTLNYAGTFKVLKTGTSVVDKYAFWSSPVASQNLNNIYSGATPAFVTDYNTATDYFVNTADASSLFAKAYAIKTPIANAAVTFTGVPNNGSQTFTLATTGNGFNLVGNPYPSNLDLNAFYTANSSRIASTMYFWDNTSNSVTTQNGATTTNIGYATYNALSSAWVPVNNNPGTVIPTGTVAPIAQGFIVKTSSPTVNTLLSFTNDMRNATDGTFFNKNNNASEGKFWLRLNSSYNTNNTFAVAYLNSASDAFDNYDSKAIAMGSDAFYTTADAQKLVIQGKAGFDVNDVVPMGVKHFENGNFVISLAQKEGIFNNGQAIYLHDKQLGTYINLQNQAYSFASNAGEFGNRFEIVYKLDVLSTSEVQSDSFEIYREGEDFYVRNNKNIDSVAVFDAAGRIVQQFKANSKLVHIKLQAKGLYIVKAVSGGKDYSKKIIK